MKAKSIEFEVQTNDYISSENFPLYHRKPVDIDANENANLSQLLVDSKGVSHDYLSNTVHPILNIIEVEDLEQKLTRFKYPQPDSERVRTSSTSVDNNAVYLDNVMSTSGKNKQILSNVENSQTRDIAHFANCQGLELQGVHEIDFCSKLKPQNDNQSGGKSPCTDTSVEFVAPDMHAQNIVEQDTFENKTTSTSGEIEPTAGQPEARKVKRRQQVAKAVKKYRNRQKQEMEYLRKKVEVLQNQLLHLKESKSQRNLLGKRAGIALKESNVVTNDMTLREELKRRRLAEVENDRLKQELEVQYNFAQSLQQLFEETDSQTSSEDSICNSFAKLQISALQRKQEIQKICAEDLACAHQSLQNAGLYNIQLTTNELSYLNCNVRTMDGVKLLEIAKVTAFVGFSVRQVADVVSKIFWADVELPENPAGGDAFYEELDVIDNDTKYARLVCQMGTSECSLPSMEKLVIRHRQVSYGKVSTIVWRSVGQDSLYPLSGYPRINEHGCLIIDEGFVENQRAAILRMIITIQPPTNTLQLPVGTIVESYMSGFISYMEQVCQLAGCMLLFPQS